MFPLMLLYEYYDIIFFFKCLNLPLSLLISLNLCHFLQLPRDLLLTSSSTTLNLPLIVVVISISIAFLVYGTLFLFFLLIYLSLPSSSNSRMFYGKNLNLTSMPEIHALFIICVHVVTAQCLSHLYIVLTRLLVSSNKSFRITIPPLSIIISVLFYLLYVYSVKY